jgi:prepilin-type processing-associated H-X9-DG protein
VRPGAKDPAPTRLVQIERPAVTVFLAKSPGAYASTYPSSRAFSCVAPHGGKGHVLFLDGHAGTFDGDYLGVGKGDPLRDDVRWLTGTQSDDAAGTYN